MDNFEQGVQRLPIQLPEALTLSRLQTQQVQSISPVALAYIGDAVFELYVRLQFLWPPQESRHFTTRLLARLRLSNRLIFWCSSYRT